MMVVETAKRELKDMAGALEEKGNGRRITFHWSGIKVYPKDDMLSSAPYYLSYILSREHDTALKDINKLREAVSVFQLKLACEYFKFANYHNIDGCDTGPIWYGLMASNTI